VKFYLNPTLFKRVNKNNIATAITKAGPPASPTQTNRCGKYLKKYKMLDSLQFKPPGSRQKQNSRVVSRTD